MVTDLADHTIKAENIHMASNKEKLLIILYSSKTHTKGNIPQKIKITSNRNESTGSYIHRHFCPFTVIREFIEYRGTNIQSNNEKFFIFRDRTPVSADKARAVLKLILSNLGLDSSLYGMHSLRIGRCTDLMKFHYPISEIRRLGRWRSNVVYKYLRS